jgi:hypothetical protein
MCPRDDTCWLSAVHQNLLPDLQETDKATMDVEAQDDGIMAKILVSRKGLQDFALSS